MARLGYEEPVDRRTFSENESMMHRPSFPSRRDLLAGGATLAAAAMLPKAVFGSPKSLPSLALPGAQKTQRVVLVVFGGGVRTRETILSDNTPNLRRMAEEGVVFPNTVVRNNGHY
ncbi:MAG: hypothetical protein VX916_00355, partial [Planctomycetota bacterium]|nr:hypothetical protein [Planctomycetota bacterium]